MENGYADLVRAGLDITEAESFARLELGMNAAYKALESMIDAQAKYLATREGGESRVNSRETIIQARGGI